MWLILFLSLIVNLTLVCGDGDVGTRGVKNFDWSKVRIGVQTRFLKNKKFFKLLFILFFICGLFNSYSIDCTRLYFRVIE